MRYADRLYFLTDGGLFFYDGQTVRKSASYRALETLLLGADLTGTRSAVLNDTPYFAVRSRHDAPYNDIVIEYDVLRDRFMLRTGFTVADLCTVHGTLYALTGAGKFVAFDGNNSYDGDPIHVRWTTPAMDLGRKDTNKTLLRLTLSGTGRIGVRAESDGGVYETQALLNSVPLSVTEIPLKGVGRVFRLRFSSVNGAPFTVDAPVTLLFDQQKRPG